MQAIILALGLSLVSSGAIARGIDYKSKDDVTLPPQDQRTVVGTWFDKDTRCTRSLEEVKKRVYLVLRCSDGSGGNDGREVVRTGKSKYAKKESSRTGDYYLINKDSTLGIYDNQGIIDTLPRHPTLRP